MASPQFTDSNSSLKQAQQHLDSLFKTPQTVSVIKIALFLLGIAWLEFGLFYAYLPPEVPLLFSKPWGKEQIVDKIILILIPASVTSFFILNVYIASLSLKNSRLITFIVLWSQILSSILALITLTEIIWLVA